jgi:hypothetical protein
MALQPASSAIGTGNIPRGLSEMVKLRMSTASAALKFVLMVGVMSFFADVTYEGSRSIIGQYLGLLGAGALAIAVITALYPTATPLLQA